MVNNNNSKFSFERLDLIYLYKDFLNLYGVLQGESQFLSNLSENDRKDILDNITQTINKDAFEKSSFPYRRFKLDCLYSSETKLVTITFQLYFSNNATDSLYNLLNALYKFFDVAGEDCNIEGKFETFQILVCLESVTLLRLEGEISTIFLRLKFQNGATFYIKYPVVEFLVEKVYLKSNLFFVLPIIDKLSVLERIIFQMSRKPFDPEATIFGETEFNYQVLPRNKMDTEVIKLLDKFRKDIIETYFRDILSSSSKPPAPTISIMYDD